ncbi:hypothetical protein CAEBREN_31852 [Caenorhabditis brenneri]|uniref:RNA helicase n=1 Tax=Caenorhabditis brenneri TaxID=135651 RepID=G0P8X2_CAEBE|nr:hypothetical protein CAEBREN_31852 [Caenorhabditis brenneri]
MVRKKECAALVRLYEREIIRCLEPIFREPDRGDKFEELLTRGRIEELIGESDNEMDFAKKLFVELTSSPLSLADDERLYKDVMAYLHDNLRNSAVHRLMSCSDKSIIRSEFCKILRNLDNFLRFLNPTALLGFLGSYPQHYEDLVRVFNEWRNTEENEEDNQENMKKAILKMVPLFGEFAVYDIMYSIHEHTTNDNRQEAKSFIEQLLHLKEGEFRRYYGIFHFSDSINADRLQRNGQMYICPIHESATEMLVYIGSPNFNTNRYRMINIRHDNIQPEDSVQRLVIQSVRHRIDQQRQLCLRGYQQELCRVALRGENTIVTAPTGSGKTVIAANIIKNHFETRERQGRRFKALFMTPNSMILKQQCDSISSYLDHVYQVTIKVQKIENDEDFQVQIVQGADNIPVRDAIKSKDLIVATPQMIVNLCNEHKDESRSENDIGIERFFLSTFTIIFFDECHSTLKNSPYANIMREYHTLKNMGNMPENHHLPQIVGLTASLGTGEGKNLLGVKDHIASLCANMDVKELSIVKENLDELRDYSPIVPDSELSLEKLLKTAYTTAFHRSQKSAIVKGIPMVPSRNSRSVLNEHIQVQEGQQIQPRFDDREYAPTNTFITAPEDKEHSGYLNWVCNQMNLVSITNFTDRRTKISINEALEVLKECYLTLNYNVNFNPEVALRYLRDEIENRVRNFTPEMSRIWDQYHNRLVTTGTAQNSMILNLEQFVVDQNEQSPDSRAIVFVRTRYEAKILNEILNNSERLRNIGVKSDWISGLNKSTSGSGEIAASKQKQAEKLRKFANGEVRLLVSTSVAEEGLDVAACSLVIKYNYATNEIAHVQRRGRGRARNSTCVLITNSVALRDQESSNRDKENMMNQTLLTIQSNPIAFKETVAVEIGKIWNRIVREDTERAQHVAEQVNQNILYRIVCKKCEVFLCTNKDVRSRNTQYLVCRPEFWSLILCRGANCGATLGRLLDINSVELPCLGAEGMFYELIRFYHHVEYYSYRHHQRWNRGKK